MDFKPQGHQPVALSVMAVYQNTVSTPSVLVLAFQPSWSPACYLLYPPESPSWMTRFPSLSVALTGTQAAPTPRHCLFSVQGVSRPEQRKLMKERNEVTLKWWVTLEEAWRGRERINLWKFISINFFSQTTRLLIWLNILRIFPNRTILLSTAYNFIRIL